MIKPGTYVEVKVPFWPMFWRELKAFARKLKQIYELPNVGVVIDELSGGNYEVIFGSGRRTWVSERYLKKIPGLDPVQLEEGGAV